MNPLHRQFRIQANGLSLSVLFLVFALASPALSQEKITFDDHAKPILMQRCSSCHNSQKREGDLDVTNFTNLMQGGGSGAVIEPQDSGGSYLYKLITHEDSPEMPPSGTKIPDPEIQMIAKWIDMGALENKGSKARKPKPKLNMAMSESPNAKPDVMPMPLKMPLEPVSKFSRPAVTAIATSPWAPITAVASPKQILLYNTQTLQLKGIIPLREEVAHWMRFSRNGEYLLAGGGKDGASGQATLYNVITGEEITSIGEELDAVLAADISPNLEYVAIGGPNKLVKLFSIDGTLISEIKKHTEWVTAIEFSPDGKYFATGDRNGGLFVWEADSGNEVFTLKAHTKSITGISWRQDGKIVASSSEDMSVRVWELNNGRQVKSWNAHGVGTTALEFTRDGHIITAGRDKLAKVWDQNGKMKLQFTGLGDVAVAVSYCDESKRIVAADWAGTIRVWQELDSKHVGNLHANPPPLATRLAWSQKGLDDATKTHAPLAQQAATTKTNLEALTESLNGAKQSQVATQAKLTQTQQQLAAAKKQFDSTAAQHVQWKKELDDKSVANPLIKESLDKAVAASTALPADAELKAAATVLKNKLAQIQARIAELTPLVTKADQEKTTTKAQIDTLTKSVQTFQSESQNIAAQVKKLEGEHANVTATLAAQNKAAAEALIKVQQTQVAVNLWKAEIAFIEQLANLKSQVAAKEEIVDQRQTVVDQANQKLQEAQKLVEQAVQQRTAVETEAAKIKEQILKLRGGKK